MNLKSSLLVLFVFGLGLAVSANEARAADIQWNGYYRAEGVFMKNLKLDNNQNQETSYLLHHLVLSPKIVAMDGLNIYSRFDIFNNALSNNQAGQFFGSYGGNTTTSTGQPVPSSVMTRTGQAESLAVSELYMNWVNEFGAVVAGRVPLNFGLGMLNNDGHGDGDHYLSTRDMVGYRVTMGNFYMMPAYGKVKEGFLNNEDDVNDYMVLLEYKNPESDMEMGVLYDVRVAPRDGGGLFNGNDLPTGFFNSGNLPVTITGGYNVATASFYVKKKSDYFNLGLELGFSNGDSGLSYTGGRTIDIAGFGVAGEVSYRMGSVTLDMRLGMASGDDQDTTRYEGFFFSPNYGIAMLMFNRSMGQYDVLKTALMGSTAPTASTTAAVQALAGLDTEVISNAVYFAPKVNWAVGERYDLFSNFCYAITQKSPLSTTNGGASVGSSLGFEVDIGMRYHLGEKFTWETQIGAFMPGTAFAGGTTNNFKTETSYGATTKATIHF